MYMPTMPTTIGRSSPPTAESPSCSSCLSPLPLRFPRQFGTPGGWDLIAVMLHACVDYPFPRPAVSGWMFAMLAVLYMAQAADRQRLRGAPMPTSSMRWNRFRACDEDADIGFHNWVESSSLPARFNLYRCCHQPA